MPDSERLPSDAPQRGPRKRFRLPENRSPYILVLLLAVTLSGFQLVQDQDLFKLRRSFEIFGSLYEQLVIGYVDELDAEKTMNRGIAAMLSDLDPYTVYSDQSQQASFAASQGGYVQVGLNLGMINGQITVLEPSSDASAYKQGIKVGDVVRTIAGRAASTLSMADAFTLLRGEPGTTVTVDVSREGVDGQIEFVLTRQKESTESVPLSEFLYGDSLLGIGYIKLTSFQQNSHREFRRALNDLDDTGHLKAVVIDLRDNLGGYVDAAVAMIEMFVPKGSTVLTMRGRTPDTIRQFETKLDPIISDRPVIILMNSMSASASEIFAGAIQDLDRGVIVGTTSFGKGLVQTVRPLPHNSALKLTIARYYTPSGRSIQAIDYRAHDGSPVPVPDSLRTAYKTSKGRTVKDGRGIEPDVTTRSMTETEIEQALKRQSAFFFFANSFAATHETIDPNFRIDDDTYEAFKTWLNGQDFSYSSASDAALDDLVASMNESNRTEITREVDRIRSFVADEKRRDLDRHRDRIEVHLREQILARFFEHAEHTRALLVDDPDIETAIELVRDRRKYDEILRPR